MVAVETPVRYPFALRASNEDDGATATLKLFVSTRRDSTEDEATDVNETLFDDIVTSAPIVTSLYVASATAGRRSAMAPESIPSIFFIRLP